MPSSPSAQLQSQNPTSTENVLFQIPYHAVLGFLIPLLVSVLQIFAQGTTKSLFETHKENMWVFVVATIIYCFTFATDMKYRVIRGRSSRLLRSIAAISGSLSPASLVSILLPLKFGYLIYIAWGVAICIVVAYQYANLDKNIFDWLHYLMKNTISKFSDLWNGFTGRNLMDEPQIPV